MGTGGYPIPCILRSWALLDCATGTMHPCLPRVQVPEVIFSDDGRHMVLSLEEMLHNLAESCGFAAVSGGTMNASKLKMYHIYHAQDRLYCGTASISCALGQLEY